MSATRWGTLVTAAAGGYGVARIDGVRRRVYVDPLRFAAPWPVPAPGDRVQVVEDAQGGWAVVWVLGQGTPTGA